MVVIFLKALIVVSLGVFSTWVAHTASMGLPVCRTKAACPILQAAIVVLSTRRVFYALVSSDWFRQVRGAIKAIPVVFSPRRVSYEALELDVVQRMLRALAKPALPLIYVSLGLCIHLGMLARAYKAFRVFWGPEWPWVRRALGVHLAAFFILGGLLPHTPIWATWSWVENTEEVQEVIESAGLHLTMDSDPETSLWGLCVVAFSWHISVYLALIMHVGVWPIAMYWSYWWFFKQAVKLASWDMFNWPLRWVYHWTNIVLWATWWAAWVTLRAERIGFEESTRRRFYWVFYLLCLAFPILLFEFCDFLFDDGEIINEEFLADMAEWDRGNKTWHYEYLADYDNYYEPTHTKWDEEEEEDDWGGRYWW